MTERERRQQTAAWRALEKALPMITVGLLWTYVVLSSLGGGLVVVGLLVRQRYTWAYGLERSGLFISASAWCVYAIGWYFYPHPPQSFLLILAFFSLSVGCLLRARAINRKAKLLLRTMRRASQEKEDS